ncbi:13028_t:CDS:2, partial [Acaulospora colombiana]
YYTETHINAEEKVLLEAEIARKCLKRGDNQCELDIMYNIEKVHVILEEMVLNGRIVETNKNNVLAPIIEMNKAK